MDEIIKDLNLSISYFVDRKCTPEWKLNDSVIGCHNLMYLYEGSCTYYVDGLRYNLKKGDVIYMPQGVMRKAYTYKEDLMHCFALNFSIENVPYGLPILAAV